MPNILKSGSLNILETCGNVIDLYIDCFVSKYTSLPYHNFTSSLSGFNLQNFYAFTLRVQLRQRPGKGTTNSHYCKCSHCKCTIKLCSCQNPIPHRSANGLQSGSVIVDGITLSRAVTHNYKCSTKCGICFHKNESLNGCYEGLNESGFLIIYRILHY